MPNTDTHENASEEEYSVDPNEPGLNPIFEGEADLFTNEISEALHFNEMPSTVFDNIGKFINGNAITAPIIKFFASVSSNAVMASASAYSFLAIAAYRLMLPVSAGFLHGSIKSFDHFQKVEHDLKNDEIYKTLNEIAYLTKINQNIDNYDDLQKLAKILKHVTNNANDSLLAFELAKKTVDFPRLREFIKEQYEIDIEISKQNPIKLQLLLRELIATESKNKIAQFKDKYNNLKNLVIEQHVLNKLESAKITSNDFDKIYKTQLDTFKDSTPMQILQFYINNFFKKNQLSAKELYSKNLHDVIKKPIDAINGAALDKITKELKLKEKLFIDKIIEWESKLQNKTDETAKNFSKLMLAKVDKKLNELSKGKFEQEMQDIESKLEDEIDKNSEQYSQLLFDKIAELRKKYTKETKIYLNKKTQTILDNLYSFDKSLFKAASKFSYELSQTIALNTIINEHDSELTKFSKKLLKNTAKYSFKTFKAVIHLAHFGYEMTRFSSTILINSTNIFLKNLFSTALNPKTILKTYGLKDLKQDAKEIKENWQLMKKNTKAIAKSLFVNNKLNLKNLDKLNTAQQNFVQVYDLKHNKNVSSILGEEVHNKVKAAGIFVIGLGGFIGTSTGKLAQKMLKAGFSLPYFGLKAIKVYVQKLVSYIGKTETLSLDELEKAKTTFSKSMLEKRVKVEKETQAHKQHLMPVNKQRPPSIQIS